MTEYLLISDQNEKLGLKTMSEIKSIADEKSLQYKIVSKTTDPPVVKLFNQYNLDKKTKTQKHVTKTIKVNVLTGENDLLTKAKMINKFLSNKYSVKVIVKMKGRLSKKPDLANETMGQLLDMVEVSYSKSNTIFLSTWDISCMLTPNK